MTDMSGFTRRIALRAGAFGVATVAGLGALGGEAGAAAAPRRRTMSFDEGWRFLRGEAQGAAAAGFDDSAWRTLDLPHDFRIEDLPGLQSDDGGATADPSAHLYLSNPAAIAAAPKQIGPFTQLTDPTPLFGGRGQGWTVGGIGWYRKRFTLENLPEQARVEVRFDGAYRAAQTWLNGVELGTNFYGYTPFFYDLTPHLKRGEENVIAVRVEDVGQTGRWYTGSGIYRHTWLTITDPVRVPTFGVFVTTPKVGERSTVRTQVEVTNDGNDAAPVAVRTTLLDPQGRQVATGTSEARWLKAGELATFTPQQTITHSQLWAPEHPNLYTARVEVLNDRRVVDSVDQTFGIRSIALDKDRGFLLNGKPIKFAGANVHHDHGPLGAVALDRSEERRIQILKERGFNAYRTSHNPPTPSTLEYCDRLGMLVIDETFDHWDDPKTPQAYREFPQDWERSFTAHIRRDRNHPSVVIWSIGNEIGVATTPNVPPGMSSAERGAILIAHLRELDKTRPIQRGGYYDDAAWEQCDMGDEHYKADLGPARAAHPDKVISQSESYPSEIYDCWAFEQKHPWAAGNFVWTGWDHIGETGLGVCPVDVADTGATPVVTGAAALFGAHPYPWVLSGASDIDLIGQPRPQNFWRQVVHGFSQVEMLVERPLPPGVEQRGILWGWYDELESWTWTEVGRTMRVRVYTSGGEVELLLNGKSVGKQSLQAADRMIAVFDIGYEPGELTAVARNGGNEIGRKTLTTVGKPAALRLVSDVQALTTSRDDLAHVLVEVIDEQGCRVPDATLRVDFTVEGAGTLMGVGNGNPHNVDSFQRPRRWTYHGKALAILRPAKTPGTLMLVATADGLRSARIALPVRAPSAR